MFYKPAGVATEIRSGWLVKSPPSKKMKTEVTDLAQWSKNITAPWMFIYFIKHNCSLNHFFLQKSWKLRYFVLFKLSDHDHQLRYFRSATDKDRPLGGIDLSQYVIALAVSRELVVSRHTKLTFCDPLICLSFCQYLCVVCEP